MIASAPESHWRIVIFFNLGAVRWSYAAILNIDPNYEARINGKDTGDKKPAD
jgi:hypothetical protein